ncbi:MAG: radical SAM protein [Verrucomicrobiia bacterium]
MIAISFKNYLKYLSFISPEAGQWTRRALRVREFAKSAFTNRPEVVPTSDTLLHEDYTIRPPDTFCISPGHVCNLRCPYCPTGQRLGRLSKGVLSYENFATILRKIAPYAKHVWLFYWGEPFLNKDLPRMIAACAELGIETTLNSNLTVRDFTEDEATTIVTSGLSILYASIDGASQGTYSRYRIGGSFERALRNLERLRLARDRVGLVRPHLLWKFLVNAHNQHELKAAVQLANKIGVSIKFDLMDVQGYKSWESRYHGKRRATLQGMDDHCECTNDMPDSNRSCSPCRLPAPRHAIKLHHDLVYCYQLFDAMFIHWDGHVLPCCNAFGDELFVGNLLTDDVETVWNGGAFRRCREFVHRYGPKQNTGSVCERCPCPVTVKYLPEKP